MAYMKAVDMQLTAQRGGVPWNNLLWRQRKIVETVDGSNSIPPESLRPHIDVISATKAVTPEFVTSATIDAATSEQEINKIKNKQNTLGLGFITHCHLWSTEASIFLFHQII